MIHGTRLAGIEGCPPPAVSICVPTYNGEIYLRQCLDSILNQSFRNFEVILIDDQSKDSTYSIIREYASRDPRIRYGQNDENRGLVGNWNHCVDLSRGEWIKFLFQDDFMNPTCIETMIGKATLPLNFCFRTFLFEPDTAPETIQSYNLLPSIKQFSKGFSEISAPDAQRIILQEPRNFFGEPTAALLHRSVFSTFGYFNADLSQFCDLEYWTRIAANVGVGYIDEPLATFRIHASSTSSTNRDASNIERVSVFDRLIILHEYAYSVHYEKLRLAAFQQSPPRNLRKELAEKAAWVYSRSRALAECDDRSWLDKWNDVARRYPHLASSTQHFSNRLKRIWDQRVGWRLR